MLEILKIITGIILTVGVSGVFYGRTDIAINTLIIWIILIGVGGFIGYRKKYH